MTTLDMLGGNAASAIHRSVANVQTPVGGIGSVIKAAAIWRGFTIAFGGAAAGVAALFVMFMFTTTLEDPAQQVPTTSAAVPTTVVEVPTPTVPTPEGNGPLPVVPPPLDVPNEQSVSPDTTLPDTTAPALEVTSPFDGERFENKSVVFKGSTEVGATVLASGKFAATVDDAGLWSIPLVLSPGANGVLFVATDAAGNTSEVRIIVHLDVKEVTTTTTTTKAETWSFTANQTYGTCVEPLPYDIFFGTAKPGTLITITSPFGDGTTEVNADGKWSVRVNFPTAVYNDTFTVKVRDYTGAKKTFSFVSLYTG